MDLDAVLSLGREALWLALALSAPAVLAALLVGLVVSLLSAATQIQDQTITAVPKLAAVYLVLLVCGAWLLRELVHHAGRALDAIARVHLG